MRAVAAGIKASLHPGPIIADAVSGRAREGLALYVDVINVDVT